MFEMTASFVLTPDNPGFPTPIKLQEQHRPAFPKGSAIGRESGRVIAEWASGGASPERREADEFATLNKRAIAAARRGRVPFRAFWQELEADERDHLRPMIREFEAMATSADDDDDPFGGGGVYEPNPGNRQDRPDARAQSSEPQGTTASAGATGQTEHPGGTTSTPTPERTQEVPAADMATQHAAAQPNNSPDDRPRDTPKVAQHAPRDEAFWSQKEQKLPGGTAKEILYYASHRYLPQCRDEYDVNAIEMFNVKRAVLSAREREELAALIMQRRKEIGGA